MTLEDYKASLKSDKPPNKLSDVLTGLWYDAKGNWEKAHDLIDGCHEPNAEWAHAYLHWKEGDMWNADYWYRKANRTRPDCTLDEEWENIVNWIIQN